MKGENSLDKWRQQDGQDQVAIGVTRLSNYVTKHWKPSWYEFAGVLIPPQISKGASSATSKAYLEQIFDTGHSPNPPHPAPTPERVTKDPHTRPSNKFLPHPSPAPSPLTSLPLPAAFSETGVDSHHQTAHNDPSSRSSLNVRGQADTLLERPPRQLPSSTSSTISGNPKSIRLHLTPLTSTLSDKEVNRSSTPIVSQSGKLGRKSPISEKSDGYWTRRHARDKAEALMKPPRGKETKRSRGLCRNASAVTQRRMAPSQRALDRTRISMGGKVEGNVKRQKVTADEDASKVSNEVIPPIRSTPFPCLK